MLAPPLQQVRRTYVHFGRKKLSYFGGCDYFRLSSDPRVQRALVAGLQTYGLTVAASRSTTGNHELYERLEKRLATFFGAPAAVFLSSGYLGNLAVAQALAGTFSHVLVDERAHASLVDATQFFDCPIIRFKHRQPGDIGKILQRIGRGAKPIALTDGLFSHNGSIAPLKEILTLLPPDGMVLVDDAHAAGLLGKRGRGTPEFESVSRSRIIQTIALSKAFGAYGGAVLCSFRLQQQIREKSRLFNGNTPLPLPLASASLKAIEILASDHEARKRLAKNVAYVKGALEQMSYGMTPGPAPVVPLVPRDSREVRRLKRQCISNGVFPSFIKYPGGPSQGYFRFALSSEHSRAQLDQLLRVFERNAAYDEITG